MIFDHQKQRIKMLESYLGISNLNYDYGFNIWGYIYQVDLSFFLGYIYIYIYIRGWPERQDGFKPLTLFRWDINIYITPI